MSLRFAALAKLSRHGEVDEFPAALSRLNRGVSWRRSRMISAMTTRTTDRMNGIRQPKLVKSSADMLTRVTPMTTRASSRPSVAVVWIQLVFWPRFVVRAVLRDVDRRAAVLAAEGQALGETEDDEDDRREDPDLGVVGRMPTRAVDRPMIMIVSRNVNLRPVRSPNRPKNAAPNGRTAKPAPKVASDARSAAVSLPGGKNCEEKNAARTPYR